MRKRTMVRRARALVVMTALVVLAASGLLPAPRAAAADGPSRTGEIAVTVAVSDGKALKEGTVFAKAGTAAVRSAGEPVTVAGVPVGKTAVTVDARVASGEGTSRYLGVAEATVAENQSVAVTVTVSPAPVVDDFCLGCHPNPRDPNVQPKPNQIVRDIHTSGRQYPDKGYDQYLAQNRRHNEEVARLRAEGKTENLPMPIEARKVMVGGKEVERFFYTCETCHTLHGESPGSKYTRGPFKDRSDLCMGCHF